MKKLILASDSPRRKEILEIFTSDFLQISPNIEESFDQDFDFLTNLMSVARAKARSVGVTYPDQIVLACDTVVYFEGKIYPKAKNIEEGKRFLQDLSGNYHQVYSAFALELYGENLSVVDYSLSKVKFKDLSEAMIDSYLSSGQWKDKAGAYGIQSKGSILVEEIIGDYFNVVGLPISKIYDYLTSYFAYDLLEEGNDL